MTTGAQDPVVACCSRLYGNPLAELLAGESLHPGGLAATRELLTAARLGPGARLLDVGCGLGASARLAASEYGLQVDAVDASPAVVARAAARASEARVHWAVGTLPDLPFDDATFDAVLAECVLSTMDRPAALSELARVTRPGGSLLLSDVEAMGVALPRLGHRIVGAALCITDAWRPGEMDARLKEAGFSVVRRWDRSHTIVELADRIDARLAIVGAAARDLGLDLGSLLGPTILDANDESFRITAARDAIDAVRDAVRDGTLRYNVVVATAGANA
ncbi:MAG: methyltransferase domain-containing protein [Chloroflexota bacterium]